MARVDGGGQLYWASDGFGAPLVLIHGFSFDCRMWQNQVSALSKRWRVLRYDMRGFGRSSLPTGAYSHVDDLRRLIGALELERPVLIGLSLGAVAALNYATRFAPLLGGLILASPGFPGWKWTTPRPPEAVADHARHYGVEAAKTFWLDHEIFASARRTGGGFAQIATMVGDYSGWHWQTGDNPRWDDDLSDSLHRVTTPTLVVSGEHDIAGYRDIAAALAARLPCARLVRLDAGHMLNIEAADGFNAAVQSFLNAYSEGSHPCS